MTLPSAIIFTFVSMMVTVGYMEKVLNKKINLDLRIAKTKARLNAESGVAITLAGPTDAGQFVPGLGSSSWPPDTFDSAFESEYADLFLYVG